MKFYKCDIDKTTKTSQIADIIFNPANEYTGVDFKSFVDYVTHDYGLTFATLHLISRRQTPNDVYWFENDSCSMTTLKRYLTGMDIEEDANLKFIQEIKQEFSLQDAYPELRDRIIRLKNPCSIKIQDSALIKSYGKDWYILVLDYFYFEYTSM